MPYRHYEVLAEMADAESIGEYPFGRPCWHSPPEISTSRGEQAYWGRLLAPAAPGEYQLVIELYPTGNPNGAGDLENDLGVGLELLRRSVVVSGAQVTLPKNLSKYRFDVRTQDRSQQLAAMGINPQR